MKSHTTAGSGRRLRRAVLAASLAVVALPGAAQASVVEQAADGSLRFRGSGGEQNLVSVTVPGGVNIQDLGGIETKTSLCAQVSNVRVSCAIGIPLNEVQLGGGNDIIAVDAPNRVVVQGGSGNDGFDGGKGPDATLVTFVGGDGIDYANYGSTDREVRVHPATFDGRKGLDLDIIAPDVERIFGSRFNDDLVSLNTNGDLNGGRGDDLLTAHQDQRAVTRFDMGRSADGADRVIPGPGFTLVNYSGRTQPVNVTLGSGGADDGEAGERDEIFASSSSMHVSGGSGGDTLNNSGNTIAGSFVGFDGGGGRDTLTGSNRAEFLDGGPDSDVFVANGGDDFVVANDGVGDTVSCGLGLDDTANLDNLDGHSGCENRRVIGVLKLTPAKTSVNAGKAARLKLSWRHPQSWQKLRSVTLRVLDAGAPVGEITINPRTQKVKAAGEVKLAARGAGITRKGKTVEAQLALLLDDSLAGRTLTAEVEAVDTDGARQLEQDAATIRVVR